MPGSGPTFIICALCLFAAVARASLFARLVTGRFKIAPYLLHHPRINYSDFGSRRLGKVSIKVILKADDQAAAPVQNFGLVVNKLSDGSAEIAG